MVSPTRKPVVIHACNTMLYDNKEWTRAGTADATWMALTTSQPVSAASSSLTIDNLLYNNDKIDSYDDFVNPDSFMTVNYDSARGLEKRGIKLKYKTPLIQMIPFLIAKPYVENDLTR